MNFISGFFFGPPHASALVPAMIHKGGNPTQTGDKVRFRISDVFLPNPEAVLAKPQAEEEVEGTIIDFSDSGQKARFFALVDVTRRQTVVVPVEKLNRVSPFGPERQS